MAGVSGASGLLISGTQSATSQYVQTGDWSKTDWLSVGKDALAGGAEGFVIGYLGAGIGTALTSALGKTAAMAPLLNSTSTVTRVVGHAVIGSISQIGTGMTARFAGSMLTNGLNVEKSAKEAFDLQGILMDGAIGGIFGGVQGLKKPQTFTSSQVQQVKGVGEGISVDNKSGKYSTQISPEIEKKILEGQQKSPFKNEVIGGHSSQINNSDSLFVVEELSVNADGTRNIKFIKDLQDGNISKIKKSTVFPDSWNDSKIIDSIKVVGDSSAISIRGRDGATWHRQIIDGVEIDVIKLEDNVVSGYPTGKVNAPKPSGF